MNINKHSRLPGIFQVNKSLRAGLPRHLRKTEFYFHDAIVMLKRLGVMDKNFRNGIKRVHLEVRCEGGAPGSTYHYKVAKAE